MPPQESRDPSRKSSKASLGDEEKDAGLSGRPSTTQPPPNSTPKQERIVDDWDGPDDPDNAQNWPKSKKIYHTFVPATIAFVCTIASSIYTPGREDLMRDFEVSSEVSLLPYVLYVLGLAFGPMLSAPCSEAFGRRMVYLTGIPLFALFTLGSGFANNITALCILRFLSGIFGSPGLAIGSATLSDMWKPAERATPMSIYVTTPFLGPAIGPLVGGFTAEAKGWRWTMWVLLFFTVVCLTPALFMKETYKSAILRKRAKKRGLQYPTSGRTPMQAAKFFLRSTITRPVRMCAVEPVVLFFTLYIGINFGMLYGFFAAFPYVFQTVYGFGLGQIGLSFLGIGVGCIVGCVLIILFFRLVYKPKVVQSYKAGRGGKVPPETRLWIAMIGSVMLPVSLFWFGWTADNDVHWMAPVAAEGVFACGNLMIFMAAVLYLMDFYGPLYGASAMGANNLARYTLGAAFPLFIVQMYGGLGIGWATSLLGFVSLACLPIPWTFYWFGPRLRSCSKYAKTDGN